MKLLLLPITFLALTSCASLKEARVSKAKVDQERSAILEVAGKYTKAFINKNYTNIKSITQTPFISVGNQETLTFQTKDELIQHYKSVREPLDKLNYSHSENYYRKIQFLNDSLAQVESSYGRVDKEGEVFHTGRGIYLYRKTDNNWYLNGRIEGGK
ncbi:hypothetical protein OAF26_02140 [Akkermansiaceae bacterium]|nr:hypothetical protein [Akkermansiaceae bacterium]|tara:strand:- start:510 stop:980 length:471 start_codon:yes stop_codon:yes gene_type:complete